MNRIATVIGLAALALVAGCAGTGSGLAPGATRAQVEADMGKPTEVLQAANGNTILFYSKLPGGRAMYAATIGKDGKLVEAVDQRLDRRTVQGIKQGMTAKQVREVLGPPDKNYRFTDPNQMDAVRDVWEYPWRDVNEVRLLTLRFATDGVLREKIDEHDMLGDPDKWKP